ncbi:outer membrane beta-barrel protein [Niabella terrae]
MNLKFILAMPALLVSTLVMAQTEAIDSEDGKLEIHGSVDAYYRFNTNNSKFKDLDGQYLGLNNYTSFTNSQNSVELGMASLSATYTKGKAGVVVDLGFGTRANEFSYAEENGILRAIKQGYVFYNATDNIRISAGKWGTHLGYEVLDPQLNRNYSMGYIFSYGPFSHTGLKVDLSLGNGFGLMGGVTNPTDYLSASFARKNVIGQLSKTSDNFNVYLNYVGGKDLDNNNNNQLGLTATGSFSDQFSMGYDGTVKFIDPEAGGSGNWWGSALYFNYDPSEQLGITLRGEYFDDQHRGFIFGQTSIIQSTLSFNIKPAPGLTFIPEFRIDSAKDPIFYKNNDGDMTRTTGTFLLAAVYSF